MGYYVRWLKLGLFPAYGTAGKVSWGILVVLAGLSYFLTFLPILSTIEVARWAVPAVAFAVLAAWSLLRAPYLMDLEKSREIGELTEKIERRMQSVDASRELSQVIGQFHDLQSRDVPDVKEENALLSQLGALEIYTYQKLGCLLPAYAEEFKTLRFEHPIVEGERKYEHARRVIHAEIQKLRAFQRHLSGD